MIQSSAAALLLLLSAGVSRAQDKMVTFCGQFKSSEAMGAEGYLQATFTPGNVAYSYQLDLTQFDFDTAIGPNGVNTCSLENGLAWHIHTNWTNPMQYSAAGPAGCTSTGGHYDPNFACSSKSQSASTDCVALNRVAPDYVYECSPTAYSQMHYSYCETGDLSGKFGKAMETKPGSLLFKHTDPFTDVQPVYGINYMSADDLSNQWASVVFHCGDAAGTRLVCALMTPLPAGQTACPGSVDVSDYTSFSKVDYALIGVAAFTLLAGVYYKCVHGSKSAADRQLASSVYDAGARADAQVQKESENKQLLPH